jgi:hypothetical protein
VSSRLHGRNVASKSWTPHSDPYVNANALCTDGVDVDLHAKFDLTANLHFLSNFTATKKLS